MTPIALIVFVLALPHQNCHSNFLSMEIWNIDGANIIWFYWPDQFAHVLATITTSQLPFYTDSFLYDRRLIKLIVLALYFTVSSKSPIDRFSLQSHPCTFSCWQNCQELTNPLNWLHQLETTQSMTVNLSDQSQVLDWSFTVYNKSSIDKLLSMTNLQSTNLSWHHWWPRLPLQIMHSQQKSLSEFNFTPNTSSITLKWKTFQTRL